MAKTKVEKVIDANTALSTALTTYITEITKHIGGNPEAIEAMISNLNVKAGALKAAIGDETTQYLKKAKTDYTADPSYTAAQKTYINSKV